MKLRVLLILFVMSIYSVRVHAQDDFTSLDQKTYGFYQAGQWDSLVATGKQAMKLGMDYYYLNYRMGVAYFYEGNYMQAALYLQHALEQNNQSLEDPYFIELLHIAYVYSQRPDLALDIPMPVESKTVDPLVKTKVGLNFGFGQFISVTETAKPLSPQVEYAEMNYQKYMSFIAVGGHHQFNSKFSLGAAFTNLRFMNQGIFQTDSSFSKIYDITQKSFSVIPEFTIAQKWQIRPVLAFNINKGYPYSIIDTVNGEKEFGFWNYKEVNYVLGINVFRYFTKVKLGGNIGISNYSFRRQFQLGINATYYPFGNLNLYTYTNLSLKNDDGATDFIFNQSIGFKVYSIVWFELGATLGELKNFNNLTLAYGYNIPDGMKGIFSAKFIFIAGSSVSLFLEGQYLMKYSVRSEYYNNTEEIETRINYDQWNIEGGLIWKF